MDPQPTGDGPDMFRFQKIFMDEDYVAAGVLVLPPGSIKPRKSSKDNTYVRCLWYVPKPA